jgi:hypothetical protein
VKYINWVLMGVDPVNKWELAVIRRVHYSRLNCANVFDCAISLEMHSELLKLGP